MPKGLKHTQYNFSVYIKTIKDIYLKQSARFYISWKIIHDNQSKQIVGQQYVQPNSKGQLLFNSELKVVVKLIFNQQNNSFLAKKSMLCLNYILDDNPKESILGGLVTIDLATLAQQKESKPMCQYFLQRSIFKKSVVTLKFNSQKIKEEVLNNFNWESKDLSIDSLFDRTLQKNKPQTEKKVINTRKNINKVIKQGYSTNNHQKQISSSMHSSYTLKTMQSQRLEIELQEFKADYSKALKRIKELQKQNTQLKQQSKQLNHHRKCRTLSLGLNNSERSQQNKLKEQQFKNLSEQNKYLLDEVQKVSLQLANRQKQMVSLKSDYDKLRRKEKKREKENQKQKQKSDNSPEIEQQMYYLTSEIMRLHQQLSNYRQTQIQNNQLKREKQEIMSKLNYEKSNNINYQREIIHLSSCLKSEENKKLSSISTKQPQQIQNTPSLCSSSIEQSQDISTFEKSKSNFSNISDVQPKSFQNTLQRIDNKLSLN